MSKMKIRMLTVLLIMFLLMFTFMYYMDKKMLDNQRDLCDQYYNIMQNTTNKEDIGGYWGI